MNKVKIKIWGREFDLDVSYDCYSGEEMTDVQKAALEAFSQNEKGISESLYQVKEYCLRNNAADIGSETIDNIFKYVAPQYLYVARDSEKQIVAIMCNYKFDQENGIALVFENGIFWKIGKQDIIL